MQWGRFNTGANKLHRFMVCVNELAGIKAVAIVTTGAFSYRLEKNRLNCSHIKVTTCYYAFALFNAIDKSAQLIFDAVGGRLSA